MAFKLNTRVLETFDDLGTGTVTLDGAVSGYKTFASELSNGDTCFYFMVGGTDYEFGRGTYSAGTLARTSVRGSSNADAAVNWAAGTKTVGIAPLGPSDMDATALAAYTALLLASGTVLAPITSPTFLTSAAAPTPAAHADSTAIATMAALANRVRSAAGVSVADDQIGVLLTIPASEVGLLLVSNTEAAKVSLFGVDTIGTYAIGTIFLGTATLNGGLATPSPGNGTDTNATYYIGADGIVRVSNRLGSTQTFAAVFLKNG